MKQSDVAVATGRTRTQTQAIGILYVDDDPGDRLLMEKALEAAELSTSLAVARDGVEALHRLRSETAWPNQLPDLILLDLNMPRMDGREFLKEIKADERLKTIPVFVFTTSDAERDVRTCRQLGAQQFLKKPLDWEEFSRVARSMLEKWW